MSEDFESKVPTRKTWFVPVVVLVETSQAQYATTPDFAAEATLELELCWRCGPRLVETYDGTRVREPRLKIHCTCGRPPPIPADAMKSPFDDEGEPMILEVW